VGLSLLVTGIREAILSPEANRTNQVFVLSLSARCVGPMRRPDASARCVGPMRRANAANERLRAVAARLDRAANRYVRSQTRAIGVEKVE
jgi:hypothetical protein